MMRDQPPLGAAPLTGAYGTICTFHYQYFGYRGAFCTVFDSFCCVVA